MDNIPKVVIAGKGRVACQIFRFLYPQVNICAVFLSRGETELAELAQGEHPHPPVPHLLGNSINKSERLLKKIRPDYILSLQYDRILKPSTIEIPWRGCINLHFGGLPKYRGCAPIFHALRNGEKKIGVTLHFIDEGIDTGEIIAQEWLDVSPVSNAEEIFDQTSDLAVAMFKRVWPSFVEGSYKRIPQNGDGSYYSANAFDFKDNEFKVDEFNNERDAANWLQAMVFPRFQTPYIRLDGRRFHIEEIREDV